MLDKMKCPKCNDVAEIQGYNSLLIPMYGCMNTKCGFCFYEQQADKIRKDKEFKMTTIYAIISFAIFMIIMFVINFYCGPLAVVFAFFASAFWAAYMDMTEKRRKMQKESQEEFKKTDDQVGDLFGIRSNGNKGTKRS
jgi:hypothetical protein